MTLMEYLYLYLEKKHPEVLNFPEEWTCLDEAVHVDIPTLRKNVAQIGSQIAIIQKRIEIADKTDPEDLIAGDQFAAVMGQFRSVASMQFLALKADHTRVMKNLSTLGNFLAEPKDANALYLKTLDKFRTEFMATLKQCELKRQIAEKKRKTREWKEKRRRKGGKAPHANISKMSRAISSNTFNDFMAENEVKFEIGRRVTTGSESQGLMDHEFVPRAHAAESLLLPPGDYNFTTRGGPQDHSHNKASSASPRASAKHSKKTSVRNSVRTSAKTSVKTSGKTSRRTSESPPPPVMHHSLGHPPNTKGLILDEVTISVQAPKGSNSKASKLTSSVSPRPSMRSSMKNSVKTSMKTSVNNSRRSSVKPFPMRSSLQSSLNNSRRSSVKSGPIKPAKPQNSIKELSSMNVVVNSRRSSPVNSPRSSVKPTNLANKQRKENRPEWNKNLKSWGGNKVNKGPSTLKLGDEPMERGMERGMDSKVKSEVNEVGRRVTTGSIPVSSFSDLKSKWNTKPHQMRKSMGNIPKKKPSRRPSWKGIR